MRHRAQGGRSFHQSDAHALVAEFADFILEIAAHYSAADTIHLVMDNLSTHTRKALVDRFGEEVGGWLWDRFTVHYTPKHGSWLNQAEIEIGIFSRQCLGRRRIGDIATCVAKPKPGIAAPTATDHDPVEVHQETGPQQTSLLNHTVIVLDVKFQEVVHSI